MVAATLIPLRHLRTDVHEKHSMRAFHPRSRRCAGSEITYARSLAGNDVDGSIRESQEARDICQRLIRSRYTGIGVSNASVSAGRAEPIDETSILRDPRHLL